MRDPGYISEAAWNQDRPYMDAIGYDLEQDQRWDHVAGSDFFPTSPDRARTRGVVPGRADRAVDSPSGAPATPPVGALTLS